MVVHETEAKDFSKIDAGIAKNQGLQTVLVGGSERKSGQGRAGHDVVDGRRFGHKKPGNAGHETTSGSESGWMLSP